jgi:MoaA/NifB/PqqE/SkfB family radical SAM enzyme
MQPFRKTNRSAFVNFLRAKYETYTGELDVRSYPYYLCLDPSDKCQLRCPTCPTGIENEGKRSKSVDAPIFRSKRATLSEDLLGALLDELGEYLFLINFYNYGEPLLNRNLPSFIRRAAGFDIDTEIHTNLSLTLSDQYIEDLLTAGLNYLQASIDGFSQESYQVHRVGGDLALVKKNLERFVAARDRLGLNTDISYNFLVFSFNEHEMADAKAYCEDLGITFNARDAFVDNPEWLPSYRRGESPRIMPESAQLKKDTPQSWSLMPAVDATRCPPACGWHHGFSVVTAGGWVAPCCAPARDRDDFGVVVPGATRFADVWNNDLFRASRAAFSTKAADTVEILETICTKCPYPTFLQHLYSVHDAQVIAQFAEVFKEGDPVLRQAFDLLSRARTGCSSNDLAIRGSYASPDQLFVGTENARDTSEFVTFFGNTLLNEQSPINP